MKHVTVLLAALVLMLGANACSKAEAPAGATRWEYRVVGPTVEMLRMMGADGWELVAVTPLPKENDTVCYMKRPLK